MKRLALAVSAVIALAIPAHADTGLDFKLSNATGYDIDNVYVDESGKGNWIEVDMGENILEDEGTVEISFTGDPDSCKWDLRVEWSEDYPDTLWQGLNLCNISEVTLKYDREKDETTAFTK